MRIEAILWTGTGVFFALIATVYLATGGEAAGASMLLVGAGFGALVAGWLWRATSGRQPRAEDRANADMADEAGPVGTFVTGSLEPLWLGLAMTAVTLGLVIGTWLSALGAGFGLATLLTMVHPKR